MNENKLPAYIALTQFLGIVLGPDYEVVLHDVSNMDHSIIAIANGHISGRTVGAPLTDMARRCVEKKEYESMDSKINYPGLAAENGSILRSSTFYIRDAAGELQGMLCINFDDSRYRELSDRLLKLRHPDAFVDSNFAYNKELAARSQPREFVESFSGSVVASTENVIDLVEQESGVPVERMTKEEKMKIVSMLEERGVFHVKNSVKVVAELMNSSQATIYRYLKG